MDNYITNRKLASGLGTKIGLGSKIGLGLETGKKLSKSKSVLIIDLIVLIVFFFIILVLYFYYGYIPMMKTNKSAINTVHNINVAIKATTLIIKENDPNRYKKDSIQPQKILKKWN